MTNEEFVTKTLVNLQRQITKLTAAVSLLDKRISRLEPQPPEGEMVVRLANGKLAINIQPDKEEDDTTD